MVQTLLRNGADISIRNISGKSPLYIAVENERINLVPVLVSQNADIFAADIHGLTPYALALTEKPSVLPSLITEETVYHSDSQGNTILHYTIKYCGTTEIIGYILDKKAPVNARNKEGDTSLHLAVRENDEEAGVLLLNRGADIFAPNDKGESPLFLTFPGPGKESSELRSWMITPQTLMAKDGLGNTALHYAAQWQFDRWIPLLIQRGANTEAANATGETPLFAAVKYDGPSTIRVLTNSGARLESSGHSWQFGASRGGTLEQSKVSGNPDCPGP